MYTRSIGKAAAVAVIALCLQAPATPPAYSSFTSQSTATSFHDPAASGNFVAVTTLNGYYMGQPMNSARIEVQSGGPVVKRGDPAPSGTFTEFGPARASGRPPLVPPVGSGVPSDYNNNGVVDAADYVQWRNAAPQPLWNDPTFGVQPSDYDAWQAHFGNAVNPDDTLTVAFQGSYDEPGKTGIFTKRGGQLTTIATVGQFAPSIGSTIAGLNGDVAIEGSTVAFSAGFANSTGGIFTGSGGALTTIAKTGDATPLGPLASIISAPAISGNTVTFAARVGDGTTKGIFAGNGGELTTIFNTGDAAPVGVFDDFDGALSMGGSKVAFRATYDGGTRAGIFTGDGSELTAIAQVGEDVPGIGTINSLSIPSMSGNEVAFYATWTGGEGFLMRNGTEPIQLIATKAQLFPWANPLHGPHGINMGRFAFSGKRLAFRFYVAVHAGNSIGIITVHSPEPTTLAMLGLGLVVVGACGRRRRSDETAPSVSGRPCGRRIGAPTRQIAVAWVGVGLVCGATAVPATAADLIHASAYLGATGVTGPYFQSGLSESLYLGSRFHIDRAVEVESVGGHLEGLEGVLFVAIVPLTNSIALPSGSPFDSSTVASTVFTAPTPSDDILVPLSAKLNPGHYALVFGAGQFGASGSSYGGMPTNNVDFPGRSSYFQWQYDDWQAYTGSGLRFVIMGNVVGGPGPEPQYQSWLLQPPGFEDSSVADNSEAGQVGVGFVTRGPFNRRALLWNGTAESAINLHPPGFQYSEAYAIDGTSQVGVAYNDQYADDSHAMLWHGTAQSAIDLHPPGFRASRATGVLGSSQFVTGRLPNALPFGYATHALLWRGTAESVVNLHPAGFDSSTVTDITKTSQVGYGSRANIEHALLWQGTADSVVDLHPAGFERSRANALSEETQVGFGEDSGGGNRHALLWHGTVESVVDLHPAGYAYSSADFVSDDLQIGSGQPIDGGSHALVWRGSAESSIKLTPAGYDRSQVNDVSGNYQVGWAANQGPTHAMVWNGTAESAIDLHDFLPGQPAAISSVATSIAANGNIVGWLTYRAGDNHYYAPVLWKLALQPVPGDYNENGTVDAADYIVWRKSLGETGTGLPADGNGNGEVDSGDYGFWRAHFGQTAATAITATSGASEEIPEPGSFALVVAALVSAAMLGRKRSSNSSVWHLRSLALCLSGRARLFGFVLCTLGAMFVCGRADAGTLYAATAGAHGELYILDPATGGVLRDVGPLNDAAGRNYPMEGLAFQPHTRMLYGATHYSDSADPATVSRLVTIDPESAEVTVVGSFFLGNPGTMTDLAFYENGALVGIGSYGPPQVYNIDFNTGVSTPGHLIGEALATEGGGIAVKLRDGIRYVTPTADELATHWWGCDYFHGQCYPRIWYSKISNPDKPAGGGNYGALDFDGDVLYGLNVGAGSPPRTHLVRFNGGQAIDIGRSVDGLAAIAFVPEPGTLALAALGVMVIVGCMANRFNSSRRTRIHQRFIVPLSVACASLLFAPPAMAATIDWVTVGDPGNGGNPFGLGDVPYAYRIGKYPVTVSQYVEFLNLKDPTGINTLALYRAEMSDENYGGIRFNSAASDGSKYEVIEGRGNHPANYITWFDAARFANWLHNGQGDGDTESGAYTLLGGTPTPSNSLDIVRNVGARVYIPSEDEWTKAGYYLPGAQIYFQYPTSTNTPPVGSPPTGVVNRVNVLPGGPGTLTDVGAYSGTTSPYGAYDMWGSVMQWTDSYVGPPNPFLTRSIVGAAFDGSTGGNPGTGLGSANGAGARSRAVGFRVASVIPEPATLTIVGISLFVAAGFTRRRRLPSNVRTASASTWWIDRTHRLHVGTLVICAALIGAAAAPVHAGSIVWVDEFQTGARDVALDGLGNIFVGGGTGFVQGIRKYDVTGNLLWTKQLIQQVMPNPPGTIGGIAADRFGNVYVTGYGGSFGAGGSFLSKYDTAGDLAWTREIAGADDVRADGVSADNVGNVYISGTTDGSLGGPNAGLNDAFVSKYDAAGNLQWVRQLGTTAYEFAEDVAADTLGNVFISGSTQGSLAAPIGPVTNVYDAFVAKYDAAGNLHWTQQFNKNAAEYTEGLAAGDLGNVYIAGRTSTPGTNFHAFVNKYDGSGTLEWTRQLGTGPPTTNAWGLTADSLGNVYMVGNSGATDIAGAFVAKYDSAGALHWTHNIASDSNDYAYSIAADGAGNLYIGGHGKLIGTGPTQDYLARYVIPEPATWLLAALATAFVVLRKTRTHKASGVKLPVALATFLAVVSLGEGARAQTLYHWNSGPGNNGHYYLAIDAVSSWTDASALAASRGGYLASVLSQEENDFLRDTFFNPASSDATTAYWIGLTDAGTEGTFVWTSGEPLGYTNWGAGEPTNSTRGAIGTPAGEDYTAINWQRAVGLGTIAGQWNDTPNNGTTDGGTAIMPYRSILEFNSNPLPEPPNLVLNGSFESGQFTGTYFGNTYLEAGSTAITGWEVVQSDIIWGDNDASDSIVFNVFASEGERLLDLTGFDNLPFGGVEQAIPTHPGRRYRLEFDLGTNPARLGTTQTLIAQAGANQTTFTFTGTGDSSQYQRYGLEFIADETSTLIRFTGTIPSGLHIGLDNVVVRIIPEPASGLSAAVAVAFLVIRRRRSHTMLLALVAVLALTSLTAPSPAQAEILEGRTVATSSFYYGAPPGMGPPSQYFGPVESVVGPGVELTDFGLPGQAVDVDFSDRNILITRRNNLDPSRPRLWNIEFVLDLDNTVPDFKVLTVTVNPASTWPGFTPSTQVSLDRLFLNTPQSGLSGEQISLDLDLIPEPASWLLCALAGAAVVGAGARRKTRFARRLPILLCFIAALTLAGRADAGTLYAATAGDHGELYILDPNTGGVLRDVGPLNDAVGRNYPMEALAFQPHTRVLYGATHYSDTADPATVSKLVTINPDTAEVTVVGSFFLGNPATMTDIAFYESGGLVGIGSYGPPQWYSIDLSTGISTPRHSLGDFASTEGGGIAQRGSLYVTPVASEFGTWEPCIPVHGSCYPSPHYRSIFNPNKPAGGGNYGALDFDGSVLYGLNVGTGSLPQTHLVRFNVNERAIIDIGRSVDGLAAIAFVPELASWLSAALTGTAILCARKRRSYRRGLLAAFLVVGFLAVPTRPVYAATLFFDDFVGRTISPAWWALLPDHYDYPPDVPSASYSGIPNHSFDVLDGASVVRMPNELFPRTYRGWSTSGTFKLSDFRYEVRLNALNQSSKNMDGFIQIWIVDSLNWDRWDTASLFGSAGSGFQHFKTASTVDGVDNFLPFQYQNNTWYRLVLEGTSNQNIRASVLDDNGTKLIDWTFAHDAAAYRSGIRIGLAQIMRTASGQASVDVAVDYARLEGAVIPEPQNWLLMALASAAVLSIGRHWRSVSRIAIVDGCCHYDNAGSFAVQVTQIIPEPSAFVLLSLALSVRLSSARPSLFEGRKLLSAGALRPSII